VFAADDIDVELDEVAVEIVDDEVAKVILDDDDEAELVVVAVAAELLTITLPTMVVG